MPLIAEACLLGTDQLWTDHILTRDRLETQFNPVPCSCLFALAIAIRPVTPGFIITRLIAITITFFDRTYVSYFLGIIKIQCAADHMS